MKKLIYILLLIPFLSIAQVSNGTEQEFDTGIKNNSTQTITTPTYLTTTGVDGTQGKIPSAYIEKTENKTNTISGYNTTLYPNEKATHDALNLKLNISDLPTNLTLYPTTVASDVSGYVKMVTDIHAPDYNTVAVDVSTPTITGTNQLVSQRISAPGVLIGQPGVFNITNFGNIRRVSGTGTATFYFKVYRRDLAGVETLICTSGISAVVSLPTYVEFTASSVWNDGDFAATDRIVVKTYANRVPGNSDPVYQVQYGGSSPVRTLLPVPFSVVDAGYELNANKQNSLVTDGTGIKYPTVDAINSSNSNINKLTNINHTFVKESKIRESDSNYFYTGSVLTVGSGGTYSTITAAFNSASSGDILQLANGVYDTALESGGYLLINSSTKRVLIRGNSTDNTLVILRQSAVATYCVRERTANEVTFQDLTIESNQANATITISMDTASSPVTTLFNNCIIKNTSSSAINTVNIIGVPVNNGKFEFRNCDIYQSNNSSSRCLSQSSVSDANSVLYYLPILISNSNLFGILAIDGATNLNIYNSSFFTNQNSIILSIGTDTATPTYSKSHIDIRSCYFSFTSTFTNHGVLLGRGTKDIYFINNYIKMLSGNNALSLGLVIKSIASNIDDVIIEGNYVEAPRPYYIKGAQYVSLRYNTGVSNWNDNTNGYGFEINNPLNGDGEISSIGNIVESNNFIGNIGAIGLTYNGTTTAFTSFKLCYFKNNKYTIPTNGLYLNTPSVTWENKYTLTKQDSNSILKYY